MGKQEVSACSAEHDVGARSFGVHRASGAFHGNQSGAVAPRSKTLKRFHILLVFLTMLFCLFGDAQGHEIRPAYLELHEQQPGEFNVLWKTPMRGELRLSLWPEFSGATENLTPVTTRQTSDAAVQRWRLKTVEPLHGQSVRIAGLEGTLTDALVRVEFADGSAWVKRLTAVEPAATIPAQLSGWLVAGEYLQLGVEHILLGIDHLLFVLALLLITRGALRLVKTITAFTVAHSITLGLATLGFVHVPSAPVEAVIALSIVFVAAEIVHAQRGRQSLTARQPWIVAFSFGLLHGFGFAGALSEVGLPQGHIPVALLFFNLGVEVGQLLFVAAVLLLSALGQRVENSAKFWSAPRQRRFPSRASETDVRCYPSVAEIQSGAVAPHSKTFSRWVGLAVPYAIGSVAMFWVIQRIAAF